MSFQTDKKEWLLGDSPNYSMKVVGRHLKFINFSKKSLARFNYLARKENLSLRGYIIKCIRKGLSN